MTLAEIKDYINRTLPDRTKASDPVYKTGIVRAVLFKMLDFASGIIDFVLPNGDPNGGTPVEGYSSPGSGLLKLMGNMIAGLSEVALVNLNLSGDGFSFWQMASATKRRLLMVVRSTGVAIGVDNPDEKLHVAGRIKSFGLVATGGTPTASILGSGLGSGGIIAMVSGATDQAGSFTITTGSNPIASQMARISLANKVVRTPIAVLLSPASTSAGPHIGKVILYGESPGALVLTASDGSVLPANTTFSFFYQVIV